MKITTNEHNRIFYDEQYLSTSLTGIDTFKEELSKILSEITKLDIQVKVLDTSFNIPTSRYPVAFYFGDKLLNIDTYEIWMFEVTRKPHALEGFFINLKDILIKECNSVGGISFEI